MPCQERDISKTNIVLVLLGTLIILLIFCATIFNSFTPKKIIVNKIENIENTNIKYCIDSQEYDEKSNYLIIKGWAFMEGENIETFNSHLVLRDKENEECIELPTKLIVRKDVTDTFKDSQNNFNYDKSGFQGRLNLKKLNKPLSNYEICLNYKNNNSNMFVRTGMLLSEEGK